MRCDIAMRSWVAFEKRLKNALIGKGVEEIHGMVAVCDIASIAMTMLS